jgi:hypothetical protein
MKSRVKKRRARKEKEGLGGGAMVLYTNNAMKKRARMVVYGATMGAVEPGLRRGWWVREYHSRVIMDMHLNGEPHPAGHPWPVAYGYLGPFDTGWEAEEYARGP